MSKTFRDLAKFVSSTLMNFDNDKLNAMTLEELDLLMQDQDIMLGREKKPSSRSIFIIKTDSNLTEQEYSRLRREIDDFWPKDLSRPLLLEGGMTIEQLKVEG